MNEEYVKIKISTFYRFVYFLSLLIDWTVGGKDDNEFLKSMLRDFEHDVIKDLGE